MRVQSQRDDTWMDSMICTYGSLGFWVDSKVWKVESPGPSQPTLPECPGADSRSEAQHGERLKEASPESRGESQQYLGQRNCQSERKILLPAPA